MPPEPVDLVPLLSAARVTVVAGKGGVGKTTVTALFARAAAAAGMRVLAVELLALSPTQALEEYLRDHGFGRFAKRLSSSGVIDVVATASPGIDDLVVLGKIKQLERGGEWDAIVVDGPAAGHAVTMLTSPAGLRDAVSGGPVRAQAEEVLTMVADPARCQVALVTLPETTPVNETVETAFGLEDRVGVRLAPLVVNSVDVADGDADALVAAAARAADVIEDVGIDSDGALRAAAAFRAERRRVQATAIARLSEELSLDQVHLPQLPVGRLDATSIDTLAALARTGPAISRAG
jgi:arsenite-transporting ATPase